MESCQSDWAAERQEKLAIAKERDRAKEAVLRLQEENRKLIKTDSVRKNLFTYLKLTLHLSDFFRVAKLETKKYLSIRKTSLRNV